MKLFMFTVARTKMGHVSQTTPFQGKFFIPLAPLDIIATLLGLLADLCITSLTENNYQLSRT